MRIAVAAVVFGSVLAVPAASASAASTASLPPIRHVWVVQLENKSYSDALAGTNTYIGTVLPKLGQVLTSYYATGHESLDNYISEVSGQAPNLDTQTDCQHYMDVTPGTVGAGGQVIGEGCVYPAGVKTIADQLTAAHFTWKAYMEDMGNNPGRDHTDTAGDCGHPLPNSSDDTQVASATDQYASRHDPFVYFHSIIDTTKTCDNVVPLTRLTHDLASASTTPNYSWITPNLCDDGHDSPCTGVDVRGTHDGGIQSTNFFLAKYIPLILASAAYRTNGMIIVTWDESETSDAASCCGEQAGPGSPLPGVVGPGGGHIATIVISPFTKAGSTNATPYNHYSMLRSVEDLFGLSHLAAAGTSGLQSFGSDVFNAPKRAVASPPPDKASPSAASPVPTNELPLTGAPVQGEVELALMLLVIGGVLTRGRLRAGPSRTAGRRGTGS